MRPCTELKTVRPVHKISGTLRRAPNSAQLRNSLRLHSHVIHRFDDALRNCIVAAASAEGSLPALVVDNTQANAMLFGSAVGVVAIYLPSMVLSSSVTERASSGSPSRWLMLRSRVVSSGFRSSLSSVSICASAILLDHVHALVLLDEVVHFPRERISAKPQVVRLNRIFITQLIAAFDNPPVRRSIRDDPNIRFVALENLRPRHKRARRLKLTD